MRSSKARMRSSPNPSRGQGLNVSSHSTFVRAPGARFASVRFVTGRLDPLASREAFLDLARRVAVPILLVYGAETPPSASIS